VITLNLAPIVSSNSFGTMYPVVPVPVAPHLGGSLASRTSSMVLKGVSERMYSKSVVREALPIQANLAQSNLISGLPIGWST
jgi:hypothetical protein